LQVWDKAHQLTLIAYLETRSFPKEELFGLTSQIRRCAASIGANIAEGCGRGSDSDFARFLQIAMGSASELEYHFVLAHDLDLIHADVHKNLEGRVREIKKMLTALIAKVKARIKKA
jgi:four helix bundle protein